MSKKCRNPSPLLSKAQLQAIAKLLTGSSVRAVANDAKVSPRTIQRWLKNPEFSHELREGRRTAFSALISRVVGSGELALSVMHRALSEGELSTQVTVASKIIDWGIRYQSTEALEARIAALEARQESLENEETDDDEEF